MSNQLLTDPKALRMFFTDPVYVPASQPEPAKPAALVESPAPQPLVNAPSPPAPITFMGKNEKKILILVNDAEYPVSTPEGAALLKNILRHLQLTIADFAMVNYQQHKEATFTGMQQFFSCRIALIFGVQPPELGIDNAAAAQTFIHNDTRIVLGANLNEMQASNGAKKEFLNALKSIEKW